MTRPAWVLSALAMASFVGSVALVEWVFPDPDTATVRLAALAVLAAVGGALVGAAAASGWRPDQLGRNGFLLIAVCTLVVPPVVAGIGVNRDDPTPAPVRPPTVAGPSPVGPSAATGEATAPADGSCKDGPGLARVCTGEGGERYGFTAVPQVQFADGTLAGELRTSENALLAPNPDAVTPDTVTVIWFGSLTCPAPVSADCTYQAELEDLQGLRLVRNWAATARAAGRTSVRVVLANGGKDMRYARHVVDMVIAAAPRLGAKVVAVGGGDSRQVTSDAYGLLLSHGIPLVSGVLTADRPAHDGQPLRDFLDDREGYLSITPSNSAMAADMLDWLHGRPGPAPTELQVWQQPDDRDLYTTSLRDDLVNLSSGQLEIRHVTRLDPADRSICASASAPAAVFFAGRWLHFATFLNEVRDVCGDGHPYLVIADGSVNRAMNSNQARQRLPGRNDWRMAYYGAGWQCTELRIRAAGHDPGQVEAAALLAGARQDEARTCATANSVQLGNHVALTWDEVSLALDLNLGAPLGELRTDGGHTLITTDLARPGPVRVVAGRLMGGRIMPSVLFCVAKVNGWVTAEEASRASRDSGSCPPEPAPASAITRPPTRRN